MIDAMSHNSIGEQEINSQHHSSSASLTDRHSNPNSTTSNESISSSSSSSSRLHQEDHHNENHGITSSSASSSTSSSPTHHHQQQQSTLPHELEGDGLALATLSFPHKLYCMLENEKSSIVRWASHGYCFFIVDYHAFVDEIIPKYFHRKSPSIYASF